MRSLPSPLPSAQDKRTARRKAGDEGEARALAHLQQAGLRLLRSNFLCQGGEIDLIMQDGDSIVFVEVRRRTSMRFGGAIASVTPAKQRKMVHAAQVFLMTLNTQPACRFDLVAIESDTLHWLQNVIVA
ncbi:YraN family protein [Undibacterium sp. SXout7W]|uniref:YraN family protein n=1 Tax=Undibacterium sp. SXout7W TaxID=3413049 RepID=UPI003BEF7AD6